MKKDFWKRWLLTMGYSFLVGFASVCLSILFARLDNTLSGFDGLAYFFFWPFIIYYILIFCTSILICKGNMLQAVIVAATSPLSIVAHGWFIFLAGAELGIWW